MGYSARQKKVKTTIQGANAIVKDLKAMEEAAANVMMAVGARGRPANPFLRNAVDGNLEKINNAIVSEISKAVGRKI